MGYASSEDVTEYDGECHVTPVTLLLKAGADPNERCDGLTPWTWCCGESVPDVMTISRYTELDYRVHSPGKRIFSSTS
jgi:hypothetical protein